MVATRRPAAVGDAFAAYEWVAEVESRGDAKLTCIAHDGSRVELRMIEPEVFGNLLQHLTGSKHHNVALREAAVRAGLKVSEYGIEQVETGEVLHCREEAEVYERLGMDWIPPELRENRGEIEAARNHALPELVTVDQIRGDLHAHTDWSDGKMTLEQLVEGARAKGYEYLNVTDHSPAVGFGMGLDAGRMRKQIERVRELAATLDGGFTLLVGAEVDILKNGSLDYSDELMAELDVVVASLHASHRLNEADQTKRLCAAMENPHVDIIGHPTGRMLGKRPAYAMDMEAVIAKAVETGTVLEVSGQPHRLDLTDGNVRMAVAAGAKLSIDTDAHSLAALDYMRVRRDERAAGLGIAAGRGQHAHAGSSSRSCSSRRPSQRGQQRDHLLGPVHAGIGLLDQLRRPLGRADGDLDRGLAERVQVGAVVSHVHQVRDPLAAAQPSHRRSLVDRHRRAHLQHHPAEAPGQAGAIELGHDLGLQIAQRVVGPRRSPVVHREGDALVLDAAAQLRQQAVVLHHQQRLVHRVQVARGLRHHRHVVSVHHLEAVVS